MEPAAGAAAAAPPLISVIVVNYNTRDLLARALAAVAASAAGLPHEVIVVDNGSTDGSLALLRERFPAARVIANARNLGFAAANNQGLAVARGAACLLLNSDAAPEPAAIPALWQALLARPRAGVVGPRLLNADGSTQSSRRRFPTLATLLVESTPLAGKRPFKANVQYFRMEDRPEDAAQPVDWLVGACLLARRAAIAQAGPLDAGFFMYAEEVEWQWRLRQAGWEVWYEPAARVRHDGGASSAPDSPGRHIAFQAARVRLARCMYGHLAAELVRAWLLLLDGGQLALEAAKWALRHKPALRRRRVALYTALLRSGLAMPRPSEARR
jgi:GT2 family glycosyltransferase